MPRNLDRRIELLVPVEDPPLKQRLVEMLEVYYEDNVKARHLQADGTYNRPKLPRGSKRRRRSQEVLYEDAVRRLKESQQSAPTTFEPHRAPGGEAEKG
jgi:polyphosphate kinase